MGHLLFFLLLFVLTPFSSANVPPSGALKITSEGQNRQPLFISNSTIIFVSRDRHTHSDPQLYFKDLLKGKEKRITHQRGQITNGFYQASNQQLFYSSTTDEDKETPQSLKKFLDRFPASVSSDPFVHINFQPQEVYQSHIDGSHIKRLTGFSGYDGFPVIIPQKDEILFSRWQNHKLSLFAKPMKGQKDPWPVMKTLGHDLGLKLSPQGDQFIWSRFSPDFKSSQILMADLNFKEAQFITLESGINWSPTWHPDGKSIIFSAKAAHSNHFDLYESSTNGECLRKITAYAGDEFFPTVSPDGQTILFTSTVDGREQIYQLEYPGSFSCKKAL